VRTATCDEDCCVVSLPAICFGDTYKLKASDQRDPVLIYWALSVVVCEYFFYGASADERCSARGSSYTRP